MSASAAARWLVLAFVSLAMFGNYYAFDALNPVGPLLDRSSGSRRRRLASSTARTTSRRCSS